MLAQLTREDSKVQHRLQQAGKGVAKTLRELLHVIRNPLVD